MPRPPGNDWTIAPCGCGFGTSGEAFVIEPCSLTCEIYLYAMQQSAAQQKPVHHLDLR